MVMISLVVSEGFGPRRLPAGNCYSCTVASKVWQKPSMSQNNSSRLILYLLTWCLGNLFYVQETLSIILEIPNSGSLLRAFILHLRQELATLTPFL
jgi:hypothetical protein